MKNMCFTMYKNNSRYSCKFKVCNPFELSCNLTGKCYSVGCYSYTNRSASPRVLGTDKLYAKLDYDKVF